ncbi:efflux RND transporter permease subunit, partial [Undibacterium luofuense]|uniref:efflux RND transporter permease subunit n=1 Tax=Undibacterium luofuense TaxID=2828733 RepID=UPI0030ED4749
VLAWTLWSKDAEQGAAQLQAVAHSLEADLKRVTGTREILTTGAPGRMIRIEPDVARMANVQLSLNELQRALQGAGGSLPAGQLLAGNQQIQLDAGGWFSDAREVEQLVVAVRQNRPVYLHDVASVTDGSAVPGQYVWHGVTSTGGASGEYPAITMSVTKKAGQNAVEVASAVKARLELLRNTVVPAGVELSITRDYGQTADEKASKLMQKLLFATLSVVALVFFALGKREAAIVGTAVLLTLTATLFASWAWGFTLNRVSLFALIFSIGILVDDAIVVVENIHRHQALFPQRTLTEIIPGAVAEVGGPTILATLTVIAALLPMAFVTGLMGPYMSPIPINASMGMLLSLAIAFVMTPWLSRLWMKSSHAQGEHAEHGSAARGSALARRFEQFFRRFLDPLHGAKRRMQLGLLVLALILVSVALPVIGWVQLKMLPFDNKSEFQLVLDMPAGTPLEKTAGVLRELGAYLQTVPEVQDYQAYAGTSAPISFNGLVRQYYLRQGSEQGDIQVNLVDKHHRKEQSHAIAMRVRPALQAIVKPYGASLKVVEVPPGPPVMAPLVAEIYGPDDDGRRQAAAQVRKVFEQTSGIVDTDSSAQADSPRLWLRVDRSKAA